MITRNHENSKPKAITRRRIRGVVAAAKELGVTKTHLSLVLHGHRESHSLLKRYHQLRRNHA